MSDVKDDPWSGFGDIYKADPFQDEKDINVPGIAARTPEFIITCPEFFDSLIEEYGADTAPCWMVETGSYRLTSYDTTDEVFGSGKISASAPIVWMKYGSWGPLIQQALAEGKIINAITIRRLTSSTMTRTVLQETTYTTCVITRYKQIKNRIAFSFAYLEVTDISTSMKPDGSAKGQFGVSVNYGSVVVQEKNG